MRIIIDCMGGDHSPGEQLAGTVAAKKNMGGEYLLVGQPEMLRREAEARALDLSGMDILPAEDVVTMEDDPLTVLRARPQSSMVKALCALRDGEGDAVVSCGNTGALFTAATLTVRRMKGVHRAALGTILPFQKPTLLLDSGANVTVHPEYITQFALMGTAYMRALYGIAAPEVGLLNNGTEACKGTPLQMEAFQMLSSLQGIHFIGNVESSALPLGACDVCVTDGFTGNICLKAYEGLGKFMLGGLKQIFYTNAVTKAAAAVIRKPMKTFKHSVDAGEHGGSPILGLHRPVIKAHGSSDARAFASAISQTVRLCRSGALGELEAVMEQSSRPAGDGRMS